MANVVQNSAKPQLLLQKPQDLKFLPPPRKAYSIRALEKIFDDNKDVVLFFLSWCKHGQNATAAYEELHPEVTHESAMVLGSRMLRRVKVEAILEVYGLGQEAYFKQLYDGLHAEHKVVITKKNGDTIDLSGADHKTRRSYHEVLGRLLKIETAVPETAIQINNYSNLTDGQLDDLIRFKITKIRTGEVVGGKGEAQNGKPS